MIFTADFLAYFLVVCLMVSFLAADALFIADENSAAASEFSMQKKAFDASEYLLWKFAPVYENAVQHHRINMSKAGVPDCGALKKELFAGGLYLSVDGISKCGPKENKTVVKRIVLCENDEICILEVGVD